MSTSLTYFLILTAGIFTDLIYSLPMQDNKRFCNKGEHLYIDPHTGHETCVECENGSFMEKDFHRLEQCYKCDRPHLGKLQVVKEPCNKTSNTKQGCESGSFRQNHGRSFTCSLCRVCGFGMKEVRQCKEFQDAVCEPFTSHTRIVTTSTLKAIFTTPKTRSVVTESITPLLDCNCSQSLPPQNKTGNNETNVDQDGNCEGRYKKIHLIAVGFGSCIILLLIEGIVFGIVKRKKTKVLIKEKKEDNDEDNDECKASRKSLTLNVELQNEMNETSYSKAMSSRKRSMSP